MIRVSRIFVLATVLSASAAVNDATTSWPQFRGPNSSGIGAGKPPVQFGPDQNVLWKTPLGPGLSSPVIWGSRIFLTEVDQDKEASRYAVHRSAQRQDPVAAQRFGADDRRRS